MPTFSELTQSMVQSAAMVSGPHFTATRITPDSERWYGKPLDPVALEQARFQQARDIEQKIQQDMARSENRVAATTSNRYVHPLLIASSVAVIGLTAYILLRE